MTLSSASFYLIMQQTYYGDQHLPETCLQRVIVPLSFSPHISTFIYHSICNIVFSPPSPSTPSTYFTQLRGNGQPNAG